MTLFPSFAAVKLTDPRQSCLRTSLKSDAPQRIALLLLALLFDPGTANAIKSSEQQITRNVLIIDLGDPFRRVLFDFAAGLQLASKQKLGSDQNEGLTLKLRIVVESVSLTNRADLLQTGTKEAPRTADYLFKHTIDRNTYREFDYILLHGEEAAIYVTQCLKDPSLNADQQLFSADAYFGILSRGPIDNLPNDCNPQSESSPLHGRGRVIAQNDSGLHRETTKFGLDCFSDVDRIVFLGSEKGPYTADRNHALSQVRAAVKSYPRPVELIDLDDAEISELARAALQKKNVGKFVSAELLDKLYGRNTAFYYTNCLYNGDEVSLNPFEFCELISKTFEIPLFSSHATHVYRCGAAVAIDSSEGDYANWWLNEIWNPDGDKTELKNSAYHNWKQLIRFGGRLRAQLAFNSVPVHKDVKTILQQQRSFFASVSVIIILAASLVVVVFEFRRRHRAEQFLAVQKQQAAKVSRMTTLGQFSAALSHELSQPLAAIANNSDAGIRLIDKASSAASLQIREILSDIANDNSRAYRVLKRIRKYILMGELTISECNVTQLINSVVQLMTTQAADSGIVITSAIPRSLSRVAADFEMTQIVLVNVVTNSIQAIAEHHSNEHHSNEHHPNEHHPNGSSGIDRITIRAGVSAAHPDRVEIEISDTGPGLGSLEAQQAMQPFFTTRPDGLGMGLAIVREVCEQQNGQLKIQSGQEGGLCTTITIPMWKAESND